MHENQNQGQQTPPAHPSRGLEIAKALLFAQAGLLASSFYDAFLRDEDASNFLSHAAVQHKLTNSLKGWLVDICLLNPEEEAFAQRQRHIGDIHARLKIPIHLVLEGAARLKADMTQLLQERNLPPADALDAFVAFSHRVDSAMCHMSAAFVQKSGQRARADEAYRLFALGQDVSAEREGQRAALMEWSHTVLFDILANGTGDNCKPLSQSPFGLWVRHRAGILFEGTGALETIRSAMRDIDDFILPGLNPEAAVGPEGASHFIGELRRRIDEIKFLLNDLFQTASAAENGHDPLTRTLNRRFLPSILGRELALAASNDVPFSVLMLDVDHFKSVNDRYGHSSGDAVLQQVADLLLGAVRPADFVFRFGGEEFLIALVETKLGRALEVAESIRRICEAHVFRLPGQEDIHVTVSAGAAQFEGHPDYTYLINAADEALYRAKNAGRNRVEAARG
ncbi:GGDEF domain-containing protein [Gellertiella hungarica]